MPIGPPLFSFEEIHRDRAPLIEAAMGPEGDLVGPRFERGCRCYAVFLDGALAGYGWLSTGPEWIGELQLEIRPRKAEAYIWNCATLPPYRRKGIFKALVVGISAAARGIGITRVWIGTLAIPGESAVPQSGFRPAARFSTVRLGGLFVTRASLMDGPLGHDARRVLAVRALVYGGTLTARRH